MWACEAQIPRGAHRIQEGANAPPPPLNKTLHSWYVSKSAYMTLLKYNTAHQDTPKMLYSLSRNCMCTPLHVYPTACVPHCMCTPLHVYPTACVPHCMCTPLHVYPTACVPRCMCTPLHVYPTACVPHSFC